MKRQEGGFQLDRLRVPAEHDAGKESADRHRKSEQGCQRRYDEPGSDDEEDRIGRTGFLQDAGYPSLSIACDQNEKSHKTGGLERDYAQGRADGGQGGVVVAGAERGRDRDQKGHQGDARQVVQFRHVDKCLAVAGIEGIRFAPDFRRHGHACRGQGNGDEQGRDQRYIEKVERHQIGRDTAENDIPDPYRHRLRQLAHQPVQIAFQADPEQQCEDADARQKFDDHGSVRRQERPAVVRELQAEPENKKADHRRQAEFYEP